MDNFASTLCAMSSTFNLTFMHIRLHVNYWREKNCKKSSRLIASQIENKKHNKNRIQRNKMMENLITPLFGSQLVNSSSKTPYSDATQVRGIKTLFASQLFVSLPSHLNHHHHLALPSISSKRISFRFTPLLLACATYWEESEERHQKSGFFFWCT